MRLRLMTAAMLATSLAGTAAEGQTAYQPPTTTAGHPDLQGVWSTLVVSRLELPEDIPSVLVAPDDVEAVGARLAFTSEGPDDPEFELYGVTDLVVIDGEHRAALIIEPSSGLMPFTPAAEARAGVESDLFLNGYDDLEQRPTSERCIAGTGSAPMRLLPTVIPRQIVQTPNHVVIRTEDVDGTRIVHLSGDAPPSEIESIMGHSMGRWEGDTLVITTTHFRDDYPYREGVSRAIQVTGDSAVIERLTPISDDEILYTFTVEDPQLYESPWRGEYVMHRADNERVYEYACHEDNYSLPNIIGGGRAEQARNAKKNG